MKVTKEKKKKIVNELYDELREITYYNHYLVNGEKVESHEEELYALGEELPDLITSFLPKYYVMLENIKVNNESVKPKKKKKYSREESTLNFINWIDNHPEFEDILNKERLKKLENELDKLKKDFDKTLNCLT